MPPLLSHCSFLRFSIQLGKRFSLHATFPNLCLVIPVNTTNLENTKQHNHKKVLFNAQRLRLKELKDRLQTVTNNLRSNPLIWKKILHYKSCKPCFLNTIQFLFSWSCSTPTNLFTFLNRAPWKIENIIYNSNGCTRYPEIHPYSWRENTGVHILLIGHAQNKL